MRIKQFVGMLSFYCVVSTATAQELSYFVNDQSNIVVTNNSVTNPLRLFGAEFRSSEGLLVFGSAAPFGTAFGPSSTYIPVADPNGAVAIDGSATFDISYDGDPSSGDLEVIISPVSGQGLDAQVHAVFEPSSSSFVRVGMGSDQRWTLTGQDVPLSNFRFSSPSNSLVPATSSAPFAALIENTAGAIQYGSGGNAVTIDGTVKLDSGWDLRGNGNRDVSYEFTRVDGETSGPFPVPSRVYEGPPVTPLRFVVDRSDTTNAIRIFGSGQELTGLELTSASGSLIPGESGAPFDSYATQNANKVVFEGGGPVTISGSVKTDVRYSTAVGGEDVRYDYDLVGATGRDFGGQINSYPRSRGIDVRIDRTNPDFPIVLSGNGQGLRNFSIQAWPDALIAGDSPAPFERFTSRSRDHVALASSEDVTIDGDVTTNIRYDASNNFGALWYEYQIGAAGATRSGRITQLPNSSPLSVSIDQEDPRSTIIISGTGQSLKTFEITSESGSLLAGSDPAPLESFSENTPNRVALTGSTAVSIDGTVRTDIRYSRFVGGEDLKYTYDVFGADPREGRVTEYPSVTPANGVSIGVSKDGERFPLVVRGAGQRLLGLEFTSEAGSLLADSADPFESFVANTTNRVALESSEAVVIDGTVTTNVFYNDEVGVRDIEFSYHSENSGTVTDYAGANSGVPANAAFEFTINENDNIVVRSADGQSIDLVGAEFRSNLGLLEFSSAAPFPTSDASETEITLLDPNGITTLDGELVFDIKYLGNPVVGDLEVQLSPVSGQGLATQISAPFVPVGSAKDDFVPEPSSGLMALMGVLGLFQLRRKPAMSSIAS